MASNIPSHHRADFSHTDFPPSKVIFTLLESLFDIAHANAGTEALLLPVLQLDPEAVDVGFGEGQDVQVAADSLSSALKGCRVGGED